MSALSVLDYEEIAFRAWPAEEIVESGGWRLRYAHGVTRRANSVWPNVIEGEASLDDRIATAEAFARARAIPVTFQVTPAAKPTDLDSRLMDRGYHVDAPVSFEAATRDGFKIAGQPPQITTRVSALPSAAWLEIAVDKGRFANVREPYTAILSRIGQRAGFATAKWKGKPIAIGLGVLDAQCVGIFNMATLPEARRRRGATAVLGALMAWGMARGATFGYLQVEHGNAPARALYRASGFAPVYDYHYRTKE